MRPVVDFGATGAEADVGADADSEVDVVVVVVCCLSHIN